MNRMRNLFYLFVLKLPVCFLTGPMQLRVLNHMRREIEFRKQQSRHYRWQSNLLHEEFRQRMNDPDASAESREKAREMERQLRELDNTLDHNELLLNRMADKMDAILFPGSAASF